MSDDRHPLCQGPDPRPTAPVFDVPEGAIDCHAHVFGPNEKYPFSPKRGYTPPEASLETFLELHNSLGGIDRAVLTQPSVYGTDNSCMLDACDQMRGKFMAIAAVDADVTDKELESLHDRRVRGIRVNMVDKGGMPFEDINAVKSFTERIKDFGWHLEVLIHVNEFEDLRATMNAMAVPVSVGHLGYMKTSNPIDNPGFQDFLNLVRDGNCWVKLSGSYRITTEEEPPYSDVIPYAQEIIKANEDRIIWGTDWPHPWVFGHMPNDGALMNQLADWVPDPKIRRKILVDNPKMLFGFSD
ncbi:MAG: amidohydrolase family protein [Rhodospirillaceae bacterium]|jgi:2-pyrone-4,6-dicarboxylate lactonase|nr:amidohydrolase family protein [Rhodospirillaceae bacterium]